MASTYEKRLLRVLDYIHTNPAGDLSLDALADVAAMSRFHWHRVFHGMTGETLADAVRRIRLHRSACWLVQTENPVAQVAQMAGFRNTQSYERAFRAAYDQSPTAFRKRGEITSPYNPKSKGHLPMFPVEIKTVPARRLLAVPHKGSYMEIAKAFEKLGVIIASRNLGPQIRGMVGVYYDDPAATKTADLRSHAGVVVDATLPSVEGLDQSLGSTVQMPTIGGYLLADAMPRHSGIAIRNTRNPACASNRRFGSRPGASGGGAFV